MTEELFNYIVKVIQQLGFPIVVALYFMFRLDKKLDKIIEIQLEVVHIIKYGHSPSSEKDGNNNMEDDDDN